MPVNFHLKTPHEQQTINKNTARRVKLPDGVFDMMTSVHGIYGA